MNIDHQKEISFREVALFAWKYVRSYPGKLFLAFLGISLATFMTILTPSITGNVIDFIADNVDAGLSFGTALWEIVPLFVIGVLYWTFYHSGWFFWAFVVSHAMQNIVQDALYHVQRFSTDWHVNSFAGATVAKIRRGMRGLQTFIDLFYYDFFPLIVFLVGIIINIIYKYTLLGVVIAIGVLFYALLSIVLSLKYVLPARRQENIYDSQTGAALADSITCNAVVKSFAAENYEDRLFQKIMKKFQGAMLFSWQRGEYVSMVQNVAMTTFQNHLLHLCSLVVVEEDIYRRRFYFCDFQFIILFLVTCVMWELIFVVSKLL